MISFRPIEFESDDYRKECGLRHEVLRVPLGLNLYEEDLTLERGQMHFGLFDPANALVACVIAVPHPPTAAKIRQMAVATTHQGKGYGRLIMRCVEERLAAEGMVDLCLNARLAVAEFYEKLGYVRTGSDFTEVGIPHVRTKKNAPRC